MGIKTLKLILLVDFYPPDRFQEKENNSSWRHCPWRMPYLLTSGSPRTWTTRFNFHALRNKYTDMSGLLEVVVTHQHVLRCLLSRCPVEVVALYME